MDQQWREYATPDGRKYWYNTTTKASTWTKPAAMLSPLEVRFHHYTALIIILIFTIDSKH